MKSKSIVLSCFKVNSKKAQLTMFIILGIIIIAVFGFVFFATGSVQTQQAQQQAQKIVSDLLETTALKFYINLCAERALENGIDLISKQGGKIFPDQKGSLLKNFERVYFYRDESNNKTYEVGYGILKENIALPQYPCKIGFENAAPVFCAYRNNSKFSSMYFGTDNLPRLCKDTLSGCSPTKEGINSQFSAQAELESYVSAYVKDCVDFESIVGINQSYNVQEGNVTTNMTFSDTAITAKIFFPIIVSPIGSQPVIQIVSFETSASTNFKQIYSLARTLVKNNVYSPNAPGFNLVNGFLDLLNKIYSPPFPGFVIDKIENISGQDDMIRIIDRTSEPGKELILQYLIENKPPVLEYIDPYGPYDKDPPAGCKQYDVFQVQDQVLEIIPSAFDTENDAINFSYYGWLENYNETFRNVVPDPVTGCVNSNFNKEITEFTSENQIRWIKDPDFERNGIVRANVTKYDMGYHNFTLKVCDSQYCDFQDIRVLIDDLIEVTLDAKNLLNTNTFSMEDPFSFTASIKDIYKPGAYKFSWVIEDSSNEIYRNELGEQTLTVPVEEYTIENIVDKYNTLFGLSKQELLNKDFKIIAEVIQGGRYRVTDDNTFTIKSCIPHESSDPPYPYNSGDPFLADHACCELNSVGEPQYSPATKTCFSETTYGGFNSFDLNKYNSPSKDYSLLGGFSLTNPNKADSRANDIIKRSIQRKCSGSRGNICTGDVVESFSFQQACDDLGAGEIARCSGPPISLLQTNSASTTLPNPACVKYSGITFENIVGSRTDIMCNTVPKCVSEQNSDTGFSNPGIQNTQRYICNATCSSNGCARTLPDLCFDCYSKQSCSGQKQQNPDQKSTIIVKKLNQCSNTADPNGGPACVYSTETKIDSCSGTILTENYCKSDSDILNTNEPSISLTIECSTRNEQSATDTDGGNNPSIIGTCKEFTQGSCSDGACIAGTQLEHTDEDYYDLATYTHKFKEYFPKHVWGSTAKLESCDYELYDYDTLTQEICEGTALNGIWTTNPTDKCCGDDPGETNCPSP